MESKSMENEVSEMLEVNEAQKAYYEVASGSKVSTENSAATNLWRRFRRRVFDTIDCVDVESGLCERFSEWAGDVSAAKVLDLGVGEGNPLSLYFAAEAADYLAIDLSEARVATFDAKLKSEGLVKGRVLAADFLSDDFKEADFDVVYAMSVMHHFKHVDAFLRVLHRRMAPGGLVLTLDPIETWLPIRLLRASYRPFQTDKAWEFPFTDQTLAAIDRYFEFEQVQGIYRRSKWAAFISPLSKRLAEKKVREWHKIDWESDRNLRDIRPCLRVAFSLRRRDVINE